MRTSSGRLGQGDLALYARIGSLTWPIILQNLLSAAVTAADVVMLNFVGQAHISAVSLAAQYASVLFMVFYGLGTGATMLCSQYYGKGDLRAIEVVEGIALRFSVLISAVAALCAFVSILFCSFISHTGGFLKKRIANPWLRIFIGGAVLLVLSLLFSSGRYNGAGMEVITAAIEDGQAYWQDFLLKILFTGITLGAGYKGGGVVPSFYVGATFGCIVGSLIGIPAGFAAAVGLISVFCGIVNCPIASIFLSVELFGAQGILFFALACGLSYVLSGYGGIYSSQRILYDKLKAQYIDVHTNAFHEGEESEASREHP